MVRCSPSADLVDALGFDEIEAMVAGIVAIDQHGVGAGDFDRARRHRRQHGVEIERGGDGAADLFEHLQLVDRLREVARALLDLGLQPVIGFLEPARHAVELAGKLLQLVAGVDVDAMAEIAAAEPPRAGRERRDRDQHPPRQDRAGEHRDQEADADQQRDADELVADRRQRLRGRLFDEHDPAELRHRAGGGQHRIAVGAGALLQRAADRRGLRRDLRQLRRGRSRRQVPWRSWR